MGEREGGRKEWMEEGRKEERKEGRNGGRKEGRAYRSGRKKKKTIFANDLIIYGENLK